jgi:hypothetical protein
MTVPAYDKDSWNKRVLPHGELQPLGDRMWMVTGALPNMPLPRNMVVFKMDDGTLLIHNAIAMNEAAMAKLEALGKPSVLVVPSPYHRLDAPAFKGRYPDLHVVAPAAARTKVEQKLPVDATAEEYLPRHHGIACHAPRGLKNELVYEMPCADGCALVFNDALFNLRHQPGVGGFFLKLFGSTGFFGATKTARLFILDDTKAYAGWLREMAKKDVRVITVAHGDAVERDASAALEAAATRLAPPG